MIYSFRKKRYGDIVKFIDLGLAGNIKYLFEMNEYDPNNFMFYGNFYDESKGQDGIFVGRDTTISPFCKFNFSSIINSKENDEGNNNEVLLLLKNILDNCLVMSDFWGLCVSFAIKLYDTTGIITNNYMNDIKGRSILPFKIENNKIKLRNQLAIFFGEELTGNNVYFEDLRKNILLVLENILEYSNKLLKNSREFNRRYQLNFNKETIIYLYRECTTTICKIYEKIDSFKKNYNTYLENKHAMLIQ
jgi:hypothetical protein